MSLRKKLYFSFIFMTLLVVFTGVMSIWSFVRTDRLASGASVQASGASEIFIPVSQLATAIYTDVNQTSLFLRAYSFSRVRGDYDEGMKNVGQIREWLGDILEIMKSPRAGMLGQARQGIQQSIEGLSVVESQALALRTSMLRVDDLQQRIDAKLADVNKILNSLYDGVLADIAAQFADKDAVGMTPVRDRTMKSWKALDDIYNATSAAEVQFWQGRGKYGEEAARPT